jgi:hypothetical protein
MTRDRLIEELAGEIMNCDASEPITWSGALVVAKTILGHLTALGLCIVPREPTPLMMELADSVTPSGFLWRREGDDLTGCGTIWRAMIAAAEKA